MSFSVWITGPDQEAAQRAAAEIGRRLDARGVPHEVLDLRTPGIESLAGDALARRAAFVVATLARHGIAAGVALPLPTRAAREEGRAALDRTIEVHLRPSPEATDTAYEAPDRCEVEIAVPEPCPGAGAEQVLRTLEVLQLLPRTPDRAYSEEEEREVIRRLKAFGYL